MHQEYFGYNSINNLKYIINNNKYLNLFLVTGKQSYEKCGAKAILNKILLNYSAKIFSDFSLNPKLEDVIKGISLFRSYDYDIIIAVGGGSVIDMAKLINVLAAQSQPENPIDFIKKRKEIRKKGKPLVAIPTTAGSGSEATHFAVVYVDKIKYSLIHPFILPDYSIIDPSLTKTMPPKLTASAGMDALSQAIESYWSVNSTQESKEFSKEAIRIIIRNLENAVNNSSIESRINMMKAANLAGKAINLTRTTACHSIAYPITSYFSVPHGHAVGLTLGEMLVYNSEVTEKDCLDKRGEEYVKTSINELTKLIGGRNLYEARNKIQNLMKNIGLETRLSQLGLKEKDIGIIIKKGFAPERVNNNPRLLTKKKLRKILDEIY